MQPLSKKFVLISTFIFIISLIFMVFGIQTHKQLNKVNNQVKSVETYNKVLKLGDKTKYNAANQKIDAFFTTFDTFDNQNEYNRRKDLVKDIVTDDVYKDKKLFKVDKYKKVKQVGLHSDFKAAEFIPNKISKNSISGIVITSKDVSISGSATSTAYTIYDVNYSQKEHKLTQINERGIFDLSCDSEIV